MPHPRRRAAHESPLRLPIHSYATIESAWKYIAAEKARAYIKDCTQHDRYPNQEDVGDMVESPPAPAKTQGASGLIFLPPPPHCAHNGLDTPTCSPLKSSGPLRAFDMPCLSYT